MSRYCIAPQLQRRARGGEMAEDLFGVRIGSGLGVLVLLGF